MVLYLVWVPSFSFGTVLYIFFLLFFLQIIYADHQKSLELQVELEWSGCGVTS